MRGDRLLELIPGSGIDLSRGPRFDGLTVPWSEGPQAPGSLNRGLSALGTIRR